MRLVSVSAKAGHNRFWDYNIKDPLEKVLFKRPGLLRLKKLRDPGLLSRGRGYEDQDEMCVAAPVSAKSLFATE